MTTCCDALLGRKPNVSSGGNKAGFGQTTDAADTLRQTQGQRAVEDGAAFNCSIRAVFVIRSNCTFLATAPRARLQSSSVVGKKGPDAINNRQPQQSQLYSCQRHN